MCGYFWEDNDEIIWVDGIPCLLIEERDWLVEELKRATKRMQKEK